MPSSTKRPAVAAAVVAAIAALVWTYGCHRANTATFERRADTNLLLVTIDTLRADALSSYGGPAHTPNLDRLAAEGERFDFAHAHVPLTRPSHASIMTGLYPFETGVRDQLGYRMRPTAVTIAMLLKRAGFATAAFVGAVPLARDFGLDKGFDLYDDYFPHGGYKDTLTLGERRAADVVAPALKWIAAQQGRWFVWVHLYDPHEPYAPPPPFDKEYASQPYYGEVAYVDQALGPLFEAAAHSARPTFTIVTADHGEGLGDHGEQGHGLFAYESTLRVPLILADLWDGTGRGVSGVVSHYPARHVDILPTLLAAAKVTPPTSLPGQSLVQPSDLPPASDVSSYFEAMSAMLNRGWAPLTGVLEGYDKYIDLPIPELYDERRDPREQTNLAERDRDRVRVLLARLDEFKAPLPGERYAEAPEVAAKLQALGYTSGSAPTKTVYTDQDDPKTLVRLDQWIREGIADFEQGKTAEAFAVYERVIEARPSMPLGYKNLAFLQWQSGDPQGAITTLERAMKANAWTTDMATQLGSDLAQAGNPSDAIALLEPLAAGNTATADILNALGIAYAREDQDGKALSVFQRALADDPKSAQAFENIGTLELERGSLADARRALERAIAIDPTLPRSHNGLGVIMMRTGHPDEAFAEWKHAVTLAPHDYDSLYNLAMQLEDAGRRDDARPYLERFAKDAPPEQYGPDIERVKKILAR